MAGASSLGAALAEYPVNGDEDAMVKGSEGASVSAVHAEEEEVCLALPVAGVCGEMDGSIGSEDFFEGWACRNAHRSQEQSV